MRLVRLACAFAALALVACGGGGDDGGGGGDGDGGNGQGGGDDYVTFTGISPDHGPLPGGNVVVVTGSGFTRVNAAPNMFLIDGRVALSVSVLTDTEIEVTMPPGTAPGPVDVTLFNNNGTVTIEDVYDYNPMPTVTAISPDNGLYTGGTTVTLTGTGFTELEAGTNKVFFGDNQGTVVNVASDTSMTVTTPAGDPVVHVDVRVENDNGAGDYSSYQYTTNGVITFGHADAQNLGALIHLGQDGSMSQVTPEILGARPMSAAFLGGDAYIATRDEVLHRRKADGTVEQVGAMAGCSKPYGMTVHGGVLYAVCRNNPDGQRFGSIDTSTGAYTAIGGDNTGFSFRTELASNGTTLYVVNDNSVGEVNVADGTVSASVPISLSRMRGATFNSDGTLFAIQIVGGGKGSPSYGVILVTINPTTGVVAPVANFPLNARGLAVP